jgi:hypothetical protein
MNPTTRKNIIFILGFLTFVVTLMFLFNFVSSPYNTLSASNLLGNLPMMTPAIAFLIGLIGEIKGYFFRLYIGTFIISAIVSMAALAFVFSVSY